VTGEQTIFGALFLAGYYATADQHIHYDAALVRAARDVELCGEITPEGGCELDGECGAPLLCQGGRCSVGVE
jgi:hypothetical protein